MKIIVGHRLSLRLRVGYTSPLPEERWPFLSANWRDVVRAQLKLLSFLLDTNRGLDSIHTTNYDLLLEEAVRERLGEVQTLDRDNHRYCPGPKVVLAIQLIVATWEDMEDGQTQRLFDSARSVVAMWKTVIDQACCDSA